MYNMTIERILLIHQHACNLLFFLSKLNVIPRCSVAKTVSESKEQFSYDSISMNVTLT